ncbi:MAG: hypothetical protein AAB490_04420, partial [Patescibacteria group bacterium]
MDRKENRAPLIAAIVIVALSIIGILGWIFVPKVITAYSSLGIWSWKPFSLFGLWPGFATLMMWVIPLAVVTLIIIGIVAWRQRKPKQPQSTDKPAEMGSEKRDWQYIFWFKVPPEWGAVRLLLGKPRFKAEKRWFKPGLHFKWWGIETVVFFDMRKYTAPLKTAQVSTSGLMERKVDWERAVPGVYPDEREATWIGAQGNFEGQVLVSIRDPFLMFELAESVRPTNPEGFATFSNDIMSSIMKEAQNRIPLMDCYVLPGMVQCFMDPGRVPATNGAKAKLRTKLEDLEAERVKKAQAAEDELAKKETRQPNQISKRPVTDKEIERDLDKEELGPGRWHNWKDLKIGLTTLGKIEISDPKSYIPEVIGDPDDDSFMKSYVGRLYQQGFYVHGYFISDFNPEKAVLKLIDEYTQKQLLRRNNLVTIRQDIDTAHGERSVREIHTVGSAKSISQLLGQIADDVLERFGIDWVPGPEM